MSISLSESYKKVLANISKASNLPTIEDETQELVSSCLEQLNQLHSRIVELSIFSPNETLDDISTRDLIYVTVPYVFSEVQGRVRTTGRPERLASLLKAENYIQSFVSLVERYEIIPEQEVKLYSRKAAEMVDFSKRRELKINQFKKEKELKAKIESLRSKRRQKVSSDDASDFDLIASILPDAPSKTGKGPEEEELDSTTDEVLRETTLFLIRLLYARASSSWQAMQQELELLRNAPPSPIGAPPDLPPSSDERQRKKEEEDMAWKLDAPVSRGLDGKGPLMDSSGKVLRPFTILPSDAGERARLQAQVFGPGHNLPTMSIDEYLQIEKERGNIITGGGPASEAAPTSSEHLAIDSEMDGTAEGESQAEVKRQKDENWARYTDENPKGSGNTMNRG